MSGLNLCESCRHYHGDECPFCGADMGTYGLPQFCPECGTEQTYEGMPDEGER